MYARNRFLTSLSILLILAAASGLGWMLGERPNDTEANLQAHAPAEAAVADPTVANPTVANPTEASAAEPPPAPVVEIAPEDRIERVSHFASQMAHSAPGTEPPPQEPPPQEPPAIPDLSEAHQALLAARQVVSPTPAAVSPAAAPPAPPDPVPATVGEGAGILLHLASHTDAPTARHACRELADAFPLLFADAECVLRQVDLPKGRFIRVHALLPPGSDAAARCRPLRARGQYCAPIKDEGAVVR